MKYLICCIYLLTLNFGFAYQDELNRTVSYQVFKQLKVYTGHTHRINTVQALDHLAEFHTLYLALNQNYLGHEEDNTDYKTFSKRAEYFVFNESLLNYFNPDNEIEFSYDYEICMKFEGPKNLKPSEIGKRIINVFQDSKPHWKQLSKKYTKGMEYGLFVVWSQGVYYATIVGATYKASSFLTMRGAIDHAAYQMRSGKFDELYYKTIAKKDSIDQTQMQTNENIEEWFDNWEGQPDPYTKEEKLIIPVLKTFKTSSELNMTLTILKRRRSQIWALNWHSK